MSTLTPTPELNKEMFAPTSAVADAPQVVLRIEGDASSMIWARFYEPYAAGREPVSHTAELPTGLEAGELFGLIPQELIAREHSSANHRVTLIETTGYAAVFQHYSHGGGSVTIRAATRELVEQARAEILSWFPIEAAKPSLVPVEFWSKNREMSTTSRSIEAPAWDEVAHHYPDEVGAALHHLMSIELTDADGRVLLWHGPPGTGKTSAIRALARAWQRHAGFQIVLDPEPVFSNSANLMQVILNSYDDDDSKWRVLVIEDADNLIRGGDNQTGQALSRLLNVGDGIVGQGLKVLVLLTTNVPPANLHPALTRPGRCLSHLAFRRFSNVEARVAFPDQAIDELGPGDLSLAEIMNRRREAGDDDARTGLYL